MRSNLGLGMCRIQEHQTNIREKTMRPYSHQVGVLVEWIRIRDVAHRINSGQSGIMTVRGSKYRQVRVA